MTNKQLIKAAHGVAFGLLALGAVVVAAQQGGQNTNTSQSNTAAGRAQQSDRSRGQGANNTGANANNMRGGDRVGTGSGQNSGGAGGSGGSGMGGRQGGMMLNSNDRKFLMEAAMGGMAEVELGRVATQRGSSEAVRSFGQRMVDDHTRANSELMSLASGLGVTPPTALDPKHAATSAKLSRLSGAGFDRAYARQMVKDHEKTVSLFQREATRGRHEQLRSFASSMLPALQEHLRMARELSAGTRGNTAQGGTNNSQH